MRENNRNSIASMGKLAQFTTMNVIDGQAGLKIYSSLIFYSLTIDNILNIIVLLILAGVSIATLTGDNGILTKNNNAKEETTKAGAKEQAQIAVMGSYGNDGKLNETTLKSNLNKIEGASNISETDYYSSWPNANESYRDFVTGIKIVEIPETVVEIGNYAFLNFKQLEEIKIPNSVKRIGDWSFSWCTSLQEVDIPDSVEYIGNSAFNMSYNITKVKLSNNLTELKSGIFYGCSLENIVIPDKVTTIETEAFTNCKKIASITIPNEVINIHSYTFGGCENLKNINIKKAENSISGSPWGAPNATVTWNYTGD